MGKGFSEVNGELRPLLGADEEVVLFLGLPLHGDELGVALAELLQGLLHHLLGDLGRGDLQGEAPPVGKPHLGVVLHLGHVAEALPLAQVLLHHAGGHGA